MDRERITPRRDWQAQLEAVGFNFHSLDGSYWDESACYRFSADEVDVIEAATAELHEMCLKAVDEIIRRGWI
jgi:glutathionylspermidine synthase